MNYLEINKKLWNDRTKIHFDSEFYDVKSFLKGKNSLNPIELNLLGDITNKSVLHLQCHFGMDTISLARMGAGKVTGIDFSDVSIKMARELNEKAGTDVRFIQSDIYDLTEVMDEYFDIIFTSYGVITWLPDMNRWAETAGRFLPPGGRLILVEFHPVVWMFSDDFQGIAYNYDDKEAVIEEVEGTYTDRSAGISNLSASWNHGLATVINALIENDFSLTRFQEYNYSPYDCFQNTVEVEKGQFQIKGLEGKIPMVYALSAQKGIR